MDESFNSTLKIRGGIAPYGTVTLSGDSVTAILFLTQSFFKERKTTLDNVPRSGILLDFLSVLLKVGVKIEWVNESKLVVEVPTDISEDLTSSDISYKFVQVLVPAILFKKGVCTVPSTFRKEAKFYRELGFDVDIESNGLTIRRNFVKKNEQINRINLVNEDVFYSASRILASYFNPQIQAVYNKFDYRLKAIEKINPDGYIRIPFNQFEFNLFVSLAALESAEVVIENYNLSDSLQYLMIFDEIAGNYEVNGNKLKVWRHKKTLNDMYEFLTLMPDAIGYILVILSLISNKPINILCRKMPHINSLITELNILGCKIGIKEGTDSIILNIRPINALSVVKSEVSHPEWGGVLIFAAIAAKGYSRIRNFNVLGYKTQYLLDNLVSLNLDAVI